MAKKLNIAIAGLGRAGWSKHFNDLKEAPDFQLVAVIDPLPERLEEAAALSGCRTYTTTGAFWRKERPDVLVVATPTRLHERHARRALREGCHVILEKPMTTTLKSADRIVGEAQRYGRHAYSSTSRTAFLLKLKSSRAFSTAGFSAPSTSFAGR